MTIFILIILFFLISVSLFLVIYGSSKNMTDEERRIENEEERKFINNYLKQKEAKDEK